MLIESPRRGGDGLRIGLLCMAVICLAAFWVGYGIVAGNGQRGGHAFIPFAAGPPSVLAGYDRALGLLEAKRDREASALLAELRGRPLEWRVPDAREDVTPSALLIRLSMVLCDRAEKAAQHGDTFAARAWMHSARSLAGEALAAPEANLDMIRTAHAIDVKVGRTALALEKSARSASASAARVARREARLRAYFQESLWPQITEARRQRDAAAQAAYLSAPPGGARVQAIRQAERALDARDADIAAALRQQYVAARAVLLSDDTPNA